MASDCSPAAADFPAEFLWRQPLAGDSQRSDAPGYHGCYLRVDLSLRTAEVVPIPASVLRQYIGGGGLGTWLLLRETPGCNTPEAMSTGRSLRDASQASRAVSTAGSSVGSTTVRALTQPGSPQRTKKSSASSNGVSDDLDALAPARPLVIAFSPFIGTPLTTSAKFAILAQSPLTLRINDSLSSSGFAIAGKKTGFDALVILGALERPGHLVIEPDEVRLLDAAREWGQSPRETEALLRSRLGAAYRCVTIGPAGENRVSYATISHDGRHAGRGGLGAVMGSKQLKSIAVRGNRVAATAYPEELARYAKQLSHLSFGPATAKYRELGTVSNLLTFNRLGSLPTRNFQQGTFAAAEALAPETMTAEIPRTRSSCAACTIGCEHIFHPSGGQQSGVRMEYENLFSLGPLCGVSDPQIVIEASRLCDELGLDTISAGGTIAFAMECAERGLIDAPELRFGNGEALLMSLRRIATREGLGDLLARGVRAAAQALGPEAGSFAIHVKGLELPGYEPRALQTMALGFAVGTRGADHNRSGAYQVDFSEHVDRLAPDDHSVTLAIETENEAAVMDSLILCKFLRGVFDDRWSAMAEMLCRVTGWEIDAAELHATANRIVTAKKWFNIQQGWTPTEDTLPDRFFDQPLPDGVGRGAMLSRERLAQLIRQYNIARGWTEQGYLYEE
ncbi:MAG: aldehyde ferredoxin oxidoreductase family protein [Planctomycetaceae bacterium]